MCHDYPFYKVYKDHTCEEYKALSVVPRECLVPESISRSKFQRDHTDHTNLGVTTMFLSVHYQLHQVIESSELM